MSYLNRKDLRQKQLIAILFHKSSSIRPHRLMKHHHLLDTCMFVCCKNLSDPQATLSALCLFEILCGETVLTKLQQCISACCKNVSGGLIYFRMSYIYDMMMPG